MQPNRLFSLLCFPILLSGVAFFSPSRLLARAPQEILDAPLIPPQINTSPGPEYADENRASNMNGSVTKTPGGRLWACWHSSLRRTRTDSAHAITMAAYSDDDGHTWTQPVLVIDPDPAPNGTPVRALIATLWTDPLGRLWLFFDTALGFFDGREGLWFTRCDQPDADEPVWTKPKRIYDGSFHNSVLVTRDGRWLIPVEIPLREYQEYCIGMIHPDHDLFPELDEERGVTILESTDQGESWQAIGRQCFPASGGEEPVVIENPDASLRMFVRTPLGIYESFSTDGGRTWSDPVKSELKNPITRFQILRLHTGHLLAIRQGKDGVAAGRDELCAQISDDEGKSWKGCLYIDQRRETAYPSVYQDSEGNIYVTSEHGRYTDAEIVIARFQEEDILAGKLVSPGSYLKYIVNKARFFEHTTYDFE